MSYQDTAVEGVGAGVSPESDKPLIPIQHITLPQGAIPPQAIARSLQNFGFKEGADFGPDCPEDDLDSSLDKMEAALEREPEDSSRISVAGVRAAVSYMRSQREREKDVPPENRTVDPDTIDTEEALEGFHWIQANVDDDFGKTLRDNAIWHRRDLNGSKKRHRPAQTNSRPIVRQIDVQQPADTKQEPETPTFQSQMSGWLEEAQVYAKAKDALATSGPGLDQDAYSRVTALCNSLSPIRKESDSSMRDAENSRFRKEVNSQTHHYLHNPRDLVETMEAAILMQKSHVNGGVLTPYIAKGLTEIKSSIRDEVFSGEELTPELMERWIGLAEDVSEDVAEKFSEGNLSEETLQEMEQDRGLNDSCRALILGDVIAAGRTVMFNSIKALAEKKPSDVVDKLWDLANQGIDMENPKRLHYTRGTLIAIVSNQMFVKSILRASTVSQNQETSHKAHDILKSMVCLGVPANFFKVTKGDSARLTRNQRTKVKRMYGLTRNGGHERAPLNDQDKDRFSGLFEETSKAFKEKSEGPNGVETTVYGRLLASASESNDA